MSRDRDVDRATAARRRKRNQTLSLDGTLKPSAVGGFEFSDIGDAIKDAASWVGDAVDNTFGWAGDALTSAINAVPIAGPAFLSVLDTLAQPIKDFANTPVGVVFFTAFAGALAAGGAVPLLGPELGGAVGALAFAAPGVARGEKFSKAWSEEFVDRLKQLAEIYGGQVAGQMLGQYLDQLTAFMEANGISLTDYTRTNFMELARKAGVPDDIAAYAVALARGEIPSDWSEWKFDPRTGKAIRTVPVSQTVKVFNVNKGFRPLDPVPVQTSVSKLTGTMLGTALGIKPTATPAPAPAPVSTVRAAAPPPANNPYLIAGLGIAIAGALALIVFGKHS